jgi:tetratricopeptide (TPR) repeat protein
MRAVRRLALVVALSAGCGVTAPSRVDLSALVKRLGPVEARHALELRIVKDPKDLGARLALAKLCDQQGRPSQALDELEVVLRAGGPIGTRWHDEDRARFARLLVARGKARIARGAPTAVSDLERARAYGARIAADDLAAAKLARAIVQLRHVDGRERAKGLVTLRALGKASSDQGELGVYLWSVGAKRAAYEALVASTSRDERIVRARLIARAWWTPLDGPPPPASDLVGPERCRHVRCDVWELVQNAISSEAIDALVLAPPAKTSDPEEAYAWLAITLAQTLRGEGTGSWAARFASRVEVSALSVDRFPAGGRAAFALVTGREAASDTSVDRSPPGRYLAAAVLAVRGGKPEEVRATLGPLVDTPDGAALLAVAAPLTTEAIAAPYASAVARYIAVRLDLDRGDATRARADEHRALARTILRAYAVDPLRADRFARDAVASNVDAAAGHAWLGALYDAIQDPARARTSWQAAVDASPGEPTYVRGLAAAIARARDPDAALVFGTQAAAASGDPSPVWIEVAEALHGVGAHVHALEAARYAIDLATAETAARAYDTAIAASDALGRSAQVVELRARRAQVAPPVVADEVTTMPVERTPVGARWKPGDVAIRIALLAALAANDPRRNAVIADLVRLAGDRDIERARAAVRALRD